MTMCMSGISESHQCLLCTQPLSCFVELEVAAAKEALMYASFAAKTIYHSDYLLVVSPMSLPE